MKHITREDLLRPRNHSYQVPGRGGDGYSDGGRQLAQRGDKLLLKAPHQNTDNRTNSYALFTRRKRGGILIEINRTRTRSPFTYRARCDRLIPTPTKRN